MRVSVVVPLFNKEKYIMRALVSVARQTFRDFEALVVDDGSSDGGAELAAGYPDRRFHVISQANRGPGAARNRGIAEARGDVIALLDADDEWLPGFLETCLRLLDEGGPEVAAASCGYIDCPREISREPMWRRRGLSAGVQKVTPATSPKLLTHMLAYMTSSSTAVRTEVVRHWGGFYDKNRCRFGEDALLWLKILLNHRVWFRLTPLAKFHREASSLSSNYKCARPVEPLLLDPDEVASVCPAELLPLLHRYRAAQACKTAGVLGFWGEWRTARQLIRQYVSWRDWRAPYFVPGLLGCTPLGVLGRPLWNAKKLLSPDGSARALRAAGGKS